MQYIGQIVQEQPRFMSQYLQIVVQIIDYLFADMDSLLGDDIVIGSYSGGVVAPALYHYANQKLQPVLSEIDPSYVIYRDGYYYVTAEHVDGTISTLDSSFKLLSKVKTLGDDPCHLSIDNTGKFLVATNYSSASAIIYRLQNHVPTSVHSVINHEGSSNHPVRQTTAHPHTTVWSEDNSTLFLADLGTDWVYYYAFTAEQVRWEKEKSIKLEDSGPRTQSRGKPGSKLIYLSCQLDNTIRVLSYNGPGLEQLAVYKVSTNVENFPSEIKYFQEQVYVALRGDDKIVIFDVKGEQLQEQRSFAVAAYPRFFAISKEVVFVTAQKANLVQKFLVTPQKILLVSQTKVLTPSSLVIL